jgi:hypothetical protein
MTDNQLTEHEAAIYDRQLRVWGVEMQKRRAGLGVPLMMAIQAVCAAGVPCSTRSVAVRLPAAAVAISRPPPALASALQAERRQGAHRWMHRPSC